MSYREGLGYELRSYDPCFNYNQDNFGCTKRSYDLMRNVLLSENKDGKVPSLPYDVQFGDRSYEELPLEERIVGLVLPTSYTFNTQGFDYTINSRSPTLPDGRAIYGNIFACSSRMPGPPMKAGCCSKNVYN